MISKQDLLSYFASRNNRFCNSEGMNFGFGCEIGIWTHFNLRNYDQGPIAFDIRTEFDEPEEFIEGFRLKTLEEIDRLGYNHSWMRYLNGNALIDVTPMELEATIVFKIVKRNTIIFSLDLHFYDEVYKHLTMPADFEEYLIQYDRRLQAAVENRYKLNRI